MLGLLCALGAVRLSCKAGINMSYVALYRKYRPQTFDDVIGQDHIITTLRNQILHDKVSHAYLFTGTRGTGKTSTAKIFARAVNCPHAKENNGNPCGTCPVCMQKGDANLDIVEMDAASNNGVDYARDIREKVQYPPVNGKYKVYIIDEVHMLSVGAFNALLKTLEEPPKHALFILCTTEVHKIPQTILSRCMRFDFRLVPTATLASHVAAIYDKEGKAYTPEAVNAIAQAGEGSVRDTVSIADRCFSVTEGQLTYDSVMSVLGVSSTQSIGTLAGHVLTNDAPNILAEVDRLVNEGKDVARLSKDLAVYMRQLLTVKLCSGAKEMLMLPSDNFQALADLAKQTTDKKLLYAMEVLVNLESQLRYALSPRITLEAALLRIATSTGEVDAEGLDRRLARLEQQPGNLNAGSLLIVDRTNAQSIWRGVKVELDKANMPLLRGIWEEAKVRFDDAGALVVMAEKGSYLLLTNNFKTDIQRFVAKVCDRKVTFELVERVNEQDVNRQLENLGSNVKFEEPERRQ